MEAKQLLILAEIKCTGVAKRNKKGDAHRVTINTH